MIGSSCSVLCACNVNGNRSESGVEPVILRMSRKELVYIKIYHEEKTGNEKNLQTALHKMPRDRISLWVTRFAPC